MPFKNLSIINSIRVILTFINLHIKVQHFISKNHISECNISTCIQILHADVFEFEVKCCFLMCNCTKVRITLIQLITERFLNGMILYRAMIFSWDHFWDKKVRVYVAQCNLHSNENRVLQSTPCGPI